MRFRIPIRLPSLSNERLHWRTLDRLKRDQKLATALTMRAAARRMPVPPLTVTITRVGPCRLDDDNLEAACKYVRDQIAREVGLDDGSDQYTWKYKQLIGKEYGVHVEIVEEIT